MKKKLAATIVAVAALGMLAFVLIYTRPVKIERRYPEIDLSQCTQIMGDYRINGVSDEFTEFVFYPQDPQFQEMVELFRAPGFRTRLKNLLPRGTKIHAHHEGDFQWAMSFRFENVPSGDGVISGDLLSADDFYGDLELSFNGKQVNCSVAGQEQWRESVLAVIMQ